MDLVMKKIGKKQLQSKAVLRNYLLYILDGDQREFIMHWKKTANRRR